MKRQNAILSLLMFLFTSSSILGQSIEDGLKKGNIVVYQRKGNNNIDSFWANSANSLKENSVQQKFYLPDSFDSQKLFSDNDSSGSKGIHKNSKMEEGNLVEAAGDGTSVAKLPIVVYPSPNSMPLVREVQENVDLYTGKLGVSVPIHVYKNNGIEVPISLGYNAGGHQVNDIASWTGLGWNLNAGGTITRVMHNLPDEFTGNVVLYNFVIPAYGYINLKGGPEFVNLTNFQNETQTRKRQIIDYANWHQLDGLCYENGGACPRAYDTQPDEFYFNFGKYSGKFVFDQNGNINIISKQNLKITKLIQNISGSNRITEFEITTDDGYIYKFGGLSLNSIEESRLTARNYIVRYQYEWLGDVFDNTGVHYNVYNRVPRINREPYNNICFPDDFDYPGNQTVSIYNFFNSTWHLVKISSPTGDEVNFNYTDNGELTYAQDRSFNASVPNFREQILIPAGGPPAWFFISRTQPGNSNPCYPFPRYEQKQTFGITLSDIALKSKRLSSITSSNGLGVSFEANTIRTDLPGDKRLDFIRLTSGSQIIKSFQLDYETIETTEGPDEFDLYPLPGGNMYGISVDVGQQDKKRMFLKSVQEIGSDGSLIPKTLFTYDAGILPKRTSMHQDRHGFATINAKKAPFFDVQYVSSAGGTIVPSPPPTGSNLPVFGWKPGGSVWENYTNNVGNQWPDFDRMKSGSLTKITYPTGGTKEFTYAFSGDVTGWNGLKIISINESDPNNPTIPAIIKNYTYNDFVATDAPIFKYALYDYVYEARYSYSSNRFNPPMTTKGNAGGYKSAEVSQPNNGKTKVEFYTAVDFPDQTNPTYSEWSNGSTLEPAITFPFPPRNSIDWQRGLIKSEKIEDNLTNKVNETFYTYDFNPANVSTQSVPCLNPGKVVYIDQFGTPTKFYLRNISWYTSKWFTPTSKRVLVYEQNGTNYAETEEVTSYKNFTFNGKELLFPEQIKITKDSRNEQIIQKIRYPLDYTATTDEFGLGISYLKTKNVLSVPVEQYSFLQNQNGANLRYVSGTLNKFHSAITLPKEVYKLKTNGLLSSFIPSNTTGGVFNIDANYKSEVQFPVYDATGHILQQNKTNDISESYKWSYNNMYPVAKAVNTANNEIDHTSFEPGDPYFSANAFNFSTFAVTGNYVRRLIYYDNFNFGIIAANKEYKLTFWQYGTFPGLLRVVGGGTTTLGTTQLLKSIGIWNLIEVAIPAISSNSTVRFINNTDPSNNCLVDELRLHPSTSQMTTYTFAPLVGMTTETDINNKTTYYEYDGLNRLSVVKDDKKNIVKAICYNYAGLPVPCAVNPVATCSAVINSVTQSASQQISVNYTVGAGTTSCRIEVWDFNDLVIAWQNSPSCSTPATLSVPATGFYKVKVIAYSPNCPGGSVSSPFVIIKVTY